MVDTDTETAPAAAAPVKRPRTPKRLQKRELTLAEAAEQWIRAKRMMNRAKPLLEEAAPILLTHFERTGKESYEERIGWNWSGGGVVLDQPKVRAFLGAQLAKFQKRASRSRSLTLLK